MNILDGIYRYLQSKTALTDLLGTGDSFKVFPQIVPEQSASLPYVTYAITDREDIEHLGGASNLSDFYISFEIYGSVISDRTNIGTALRNILHTRQNVVLTDSNGNTTTLEYASLRKDYQGTKNPPTGTETDIMCRTMNFMALIRETVPTLP